MSMCGERMHVRVEVGDECLWSSSLDVHFVVFETESVTEPGVHHLG